MYLSHMVNRITVPCFYPKGNLDRGVLGSVPCFLKISAGTRMYGSRETLKPEW